MAFSVFRCSEGTKRLNRSPTQDCEVTATALHRAREEGPLALIMQVQEEGRPDTGGRAGQREGDQERRDLWEPITWKGPVVPTYGNNGCSSQVVDW